MNNNSAPSRFNENLPVRRLAPIVSLKPVFIEAETKHKRKASPRKEVSRNKPKENSHTPQFYDKPIYKPKKYDLL